MRKPIQGYGPLFEGPLLDLEGETQDSGNPFADAPIISAYTRAQALADGVLVDAGELAKEAGFTMPVALTQALWHGYIEPHGLGEGQSVSGRLWDVLYILHFAITNAHPGTNTIRFEVLFVLADRKRHLTQLKAICGPGDKAEPVITIMLPEED